jgi:hypothetical protein
MDSLSKDAMYRPKCVFHDGGNDQGPACGDRATAVYVAADYTLECRPVCGRHRAYAIREGDGPVYDLVLTGEGG